MDRYMKKNESYSSEMKRVEKHEISLDLII